MWQRKKVLRLAGIAALVLLLGASAFTLYLDHRVRTEFEGRRFALPARIYARPLELHVGLRLALPDLEDELRELGYKALIEKPDPTREACLYVLRIPGGAMPTSLTPNLFGVKFMDTREKHLVPFGFIAGSCIRDAVIPALVWTIGGAIAGAIASYVLTVMGVTNEGLVVLPVALGVFGGLIAAWGSSLLIAVTYVRALAD